jgi:acyl carrier protein
MNREKVRDTFLDLIKPYIRIEDRNAISEASLLVDDLKVNSARFVDIILETEDRFKIAVDDQSMERFERVGDAIDFICEKTVQA